MRWSSALLVVSCAASMASADSFSSIRAAAERASEVEASAPNRAAWRDRIDRLGTLVLAYIDESDRVDRAGSAESHRRDARAAYAALDTPLRSIYDRHSGSAARSERAVMDADGDLEALYETEEYRNAQELAANALYYLNWLDYYGVRVFDGEQREQLLRRCADGFGQFAVAEQSNELVRESLLGRGLCHLELGRYAWAKRDFAAVLDSEASAERKTKARLAMLDAHWRAGELAETVAYGDRILGSSQFPRDQRPIVRFYQLQAVLELERDAADGQVSRHRRRAESMVAELERAGSGWKSKVEALLLSQTEDPTEWVGDAASPQARWQLAQHHLRKENCVEAMPLLEELAAEEQAASLAHDARYWLGVCQLRGARYVDAVASFDRVLASSPADDLASGARYYRFKAYEALMADDARDAAVEQSYVASIETFLAADAEHPQSEEAAYRLGEYRQATGACAAAIGAYALVVEAPDYSVRARFGTLQCRFELLRGETQEQRRAELIAATTEDLAAYDQSVQELGTDSEVPRAEFDAKVQLLRAVRVSLPPRSNPRDAATLLADYRTRFAEFPSLVAQAARMRLRFLLDVEAFEEARAELQANREVLAGEGRGDALRGLAVAYAKHGRMSEEPEVAGQCAEIALRLYDLAEQAGGEAAGPRQQIAIAQLREKSGDLTSAKKEYGAILGAHPKSLPALRGLARIAESEGDLDAARAHWVRYTDTVRPGDIGWFRGQYEQSRIALAGGHRQACCERLRALRTALPGLQDEALRASLAELFAEAGC